MKQKREYGKHKLTGYALKVMESRYSFKQVLSSAECHAFGEKLNVDPQRIAAWFTHKRRNQRDEIVSEYMTQEIRDLIKEVNDDSRNDRRQHIDKKQREALEARFQLGDRISSEERVELAKSIGLPEYSVRFWFSSRRAKVKRDERVAEAAKNEMRAVKERRMEQDEPMFGLDWLNQIEPLLGSKPLCEPIEACNATEALHDFSSFAPQDCTSGANLSKFSMSDRYANHSGIPGLFSPNSTMPHSGFDNNPTPTPSDPTIQYNSPSFFAHDFLSPPSTANWISPSDPNSYPMSSPETAETNFDHSIDPHISSEDSISTQPDALLSRVMKQLSEGNLEMVLNSITDPSRPGFTTEIVDTSSMEFTIFDKF